MRLPPLFGENLEISGKERVVSQIKEFVEEIRNLFIKGHLINAFKITWATGDHFAYPVRIFV